MKDKFIRQKNGGVYYNQGARFDDWTGEIYYKCGMSNGWYREIPSSDILKKTDTLKEICDEFVITDVEHKSWERVFKPALELVIKDYEKPYEIYGAVWTDNGLLFVAKMNDKGELELIWKGLCN